MRLIEQLKEKLSAFAPRPYTAAIIVAAGSSKRMCGPNKQLVDIGGTPVIIRSIAAFQRAKTIDEIVVVTSESILSLVSDYVKLNKLSKVSIVTSGGQDRQASVGCGLARLPRKTKYIAVHDGARPFATPELIDNVSRAAYKYSAAAACIKVTSTIKQADADGFIAATLERNRLFSAQTPQTFHLPSYRLALATAISDSCSFTDDCQLFEHSDMPVKIVDGEDTNIKITTSADLLAARAIAERLEQEKQ